MGSLARFLEERTGGDRQWWTAGGGVRHGGVWWDSIGSWSPAWLSRRGMEEGKG